MGIRVQTGRLKRELTAPGSLLAHAARGFKREAELAAGSGPRRQRRRQPDGGSCAGTGCGAGGTCQ